MWGLVPWCTWTDQILNPNRSLEFLQSEAHISFSLFYFFTRKEIWAVTPSITRSHSIFGWKGNLEICAGSGLARKPEPDPTFRQGSGQYMSALFGLGSGRDLSLGTRQPDLAKSRNAINMTCGILPELIRALNVHIGKGVKVTYKAESANAGWLWWHVRVTNA